MLNSTAQEIMLKIVLVEGLLFTLTAQLAVVRVGPTAFTAAASSVTFSELTIKTVNPSNTPTTYGGGASSHN